VALSCGVMATSAIGARARSRAPVHAAAWVGPARRAAQAVEPVVCSGCVPPLDYGGGPVMSTHTAEGLVATPIYWQPSGGQYSFPANYESIIDRFLANVAAASGTSGNVVSVATEYYGDVDGVKTDISYSIHAGAAVIDTDGFPTNGCTPAAGYTACLTDDQLRSELQRVTKSRKLPVDLAHFYPLFLPPGVETADSADGTNSVDGYCAYHQSVGTGDRQILYANQPYQGDRCSGGQAPNGDVAADSTISLLSHELLESMTDPVAGQLAWVDQTTNEIGDMCANTYGSPLGSTTVLNPRGTEYNQVINGGKYYLQQEFSNHAFSKFGIDKGCALSEALAQNPSAANTRAPATTATTFFLDATPTNLPADGHSTSSIDVTASNATGNPVSGNNIHFSVSVQSGNGECGTLSSSEQTTAPDGHARVTYTASSYDVACSVLAVDAEDGRSASAVIYQGTAQKDSPTFHAAFPSSLQAGGAPVTFTIRAANLSSAPVPETRAQFVIAGGTANARNVNASQVHLSYSTTGPNGPFTAVDLTGSTSGGEFIQGYLGPPQGSTLAPDGSETFTFRVTLASNVPVSKAAPLLAFRASLDQVDTASGSGATLVDSNVADVTVPSSAQSQTFRYVVITIAALVAALAILALVVGLARKKPPGQPPAQTA
jgi:hypothetical protein